MGIREEKHESSLAKSDALTATVFAPILFLFSDEARSPVKNYAKTNLPPESAKAVAKAADEVSFRAEFKKRLAKEIASWSAVKEPRG